MKYNKQKFSNMTYKEKLDLIKQELDLETHNATTKEDLLMLLEFLYYRNIEDKVLEEEGVAPFCPCCGSGEYLYNEDENRNEYCGQCGIKLDWSDIEDNYDSINYGFVPKVKITEEDRNFGNVTFKKGVHIYFCGHCGSVVSRIQKYCSECGNKIIWNKQDKERSWKEEILEKFNRRY